MAMRGSSAPVFLACALLCGGVGQLFGESRVVVISIDGFRPAVYLDPTAAGVKMPNLIALRDRGTWADRMIGVFPTVTYPSHTSLVTGTRPATHGVVANFLLGTKSWMLKTSDVKRETLWQAAHKKGIRTAIVTWPMSYGADVDYLIPENLSFNLPDTWEALRSGATPGLMESLEKKTGRFDFQITSPDGSERLDEMTARFAAEIIRQHAPALLLTHFLNSDTAQHRYGPESPGARQAYEQVDAHIGTILAALRDAGVEKETNVVIVGDHGFSAIHSAINLGSMLLELGYAEIKDGLLVPKTVQVMESGSSGAFYPRPSATSTELETFCRHARAYFETRFQNLLAFHSKEALRQLGGYPDAVAGYSVLDPGFTIAVQPSTEPVISVFGRGTHGFHPEMPQMGIGFVAAGPAFQPNHHISMIRMIDVAPTLARVLGVPMPQAEGFPVLGLLRESAIGN